MMYIRIASAANTDGTSSSDGDFLADDCADLGEVGDGHGLSAAVLVLSRL